MPDVTPLTIWCNYVFPEAALAEVQAALEGHRLVFAPNLQESNLVAAAADPTLLEADVAFGQPDPKAIADAPRLRWVHLTSAGYERYEKSDLRDAFARRGAVLTNSSGVYDEPCAEHALAFMLAHARQLPAAFDSQRGERGWPTGPIRAASRLLGEQTIVLLGYGAIARRLVELLSPFGMKVIAVRRKIAGTEAVHTVSDEEVDRVLPLADHVMNVLPGGAGTATFVTKERLALLKPSAVFYNIGRGSTVDQLALEAALKGGKLAAAYLDVTTPEPLPPSHPLWTTPQCFITPHTAGGHDDERLRLARHFIENFRRFTSDGDVADRVF